MRSMNAFASWLLLIVCGLVISGCGTGSKHTFSGGGSVDLERWQGRWLIVNYWAEWCAPCRMEIPELNELYENYGERQLLVVGVNYDGLQGESLSQVIDKMDIGFPVLESDPREIWAVEQPQVLPTTLIIGPNGDLVAELVGPQDQNSLLTIVQLDSG